MRTTMAVLFTTGACLFGMTACGDTNVHKTTTVKEEKKIDSDGNEKTKVETKTTVTSEPKTDGTVTRRVEVHHDDDNLVKLGPLEIKKPD